jgi:hypothetical protein
VGWHVQKRVVNSEREQFEKKRGVVRKTMVESEASPIRHEYAPVIFAQETVSYLESIDMMSSEVKNNTFGPLLCGFFFVCVDLFIFLLKFLICASAQI